MKRLFEAIAFGLIVAAAAGCSRPVPPPHTETASAPDPKRIAREALFGPEAVEPAVNWTDGGLGYRIMEAGSPPHPGIGARVKINYTGRLKDGTVFDHPTKPAEFFVGATIPGLSTGLVMLGTGGKATFYIPPALGYGARKVMGIPPNSGLIFDVEIVEIGP